MKKIVFVLNPHSGKALIKNALLKIIQVFSEAGYDVTVYPTKAPLDGYEYLKSVKVNMMCWYAAAVTER